MQNNVEEKYLIEQEQIKKWEQLKGKKSILRTAKTGDKYKYSEGAISFPDSLKRPSRTIITSEGTCNRCSHIILDPQQNRLRILTPVEAERLQGFDDYWTNTGMTERRRYICMGNALVVPMITRIGREIDKIIEKE